MSIADGGRILSRPIKLHWCGWESDTYTLQQNGWQISAFEKPMTYQMVIALRSPDEKLRGMSAGIDYDYFRVSQDRRHTMDVPVGLQVLASHVIVSHPYPIEFRPVDAQPQWSSRTDNSLDDLAHFAKAPLVRSEVIALPEPTVDDLLSKILDMQQAAKTQHFMDALRKEGHVMPAHTFRAQLVSIAA